MAQLRHQNLGKQSSPNRTFSQTNWADIVAGHQHEAIPSRLTKWRQEVDGGRLKRPLKKPIPAGRPVTLPKYLSDLNIQLTIEILDRIGIEPEGGSVSGCQMVSEALATSEDEALRLSAETVRRIWQKRPWKGSFKPVMEKYAEPIAKRHGPFPTHPRA